MKMLCLSLLLVAAPAACARRGRGVTAAAGRHAGRGAGARRPGALRGGVATRRARRGHADGEPRDEAGACKCSQAQGAASG